MHPRRVLLIALDALGWSAARQLRHALPGVALAGAATDAAGAADLISSAAPDAVLAALTVGGEPMRADPRLEGMSP